MHWKWYKFSQTAAVIFHRNTNTHRKRKTKIVDKSLQYKVHRAIKTTRRGNFFQLKTVQREKQRIRTIFHNVVHHKTEFALRKSLCFSYRVQTSVMPNIPNTNIFSQCGEETKQEEGEMSVASTLDATRQSSSKKPEKEYEEEEEFHSKSYVLLLQIEWMCARPGVQT